ncbi:MAG: hypothetical protein AAF732_01555 [Pseudomonadota bacterium]
MDRSSAGNTPKNLEKVGAYAPSALDDLRQFGSHLWRTFVVDEHICAPSDKDAEALARGEQIEYVCPECGRTVSSRQPSKL